MRHCIVTQMAINVFHNRFKLTTLKQSIIKVSCITSKNVYFRGMSRVILGTTVAIDISGNQNQLLLPACLTLEPNKRQTFKGF